MDSPLIRRLCQALLLGWLGTAQPGFTQALRLLPPRLDRAGGVELHLVNADETAIADERVAQIEILSSPNLSRPLAQWQPLLSQGTLVQGALRVQYDSGGAPGPAAFLAARETPLPPPITVRDAAGLRTAVAAARAGTRVWLAPGIYPGGFYFANLQGEANRPIVLAAADPLDPPVIEGGGNGMQLSDPAFVELRDLVLRGATGNGLNIDDGGTFDTPAHHVVLRNLRVLDVGPTGNRDGIKLSGVVDFRVENCAVERWGTGGSAIDMVGCHSGLVVSNLFRHSPATATEGANGVQTKGGSRGVVIRCNRFEHAGSRAVNIGGSTGLEFFRPPLREGEEQAEARDIRVEGNTFLGAGAPVAFVGVDGAVVRFNTIYRPARWALRILQETTAAGFVPCRNGQFTDNLVAFQSTESLAGGVNIGPNTASTTFQFARNWWYCLDAPTRSRPTLPVAEVGGVYGQSPQFRDELGGDFRLQPGSPASGVGADALPDSKTFGGSEARGPTGRPGPPAKIH